MCNLSLVAILDYTGKKKNINNFKYQISLLSHSQSILHEYDLPHNERFKCNHTGITMPLFKANV